MQEMMSAIEASSTPAVTMWINWMMVVFLLSIIFVLKHKPARLVLLAIILTGPLGYVVWKLTGKVHLIGIAHIILWAPLAIYLFLRVISLDEFKLKNAYGIWLCLLVTTILISLIFDVRDIFLVLTGVK
jgi:hypothetical protein